MPLLETVIFSFLWAAGLGQLRLEQPEISVSKERGKSALISCKMLNGDFSSKRIYWYQQKPDQNIEYIMYVYSVTTPNQLTVGGKTKYEARKSSRTSISALKINFLEKGDEATYYCASWENPQCWVLQDELHKKTDPGVSSPTSFPTWAVTGAVQLGTLWIPPPYLHKWSHGFIYYLLTLLPQDEL